jgi:hypothetical protein
LDSYQQPNLQATALKLEGNEVDSDMKSKPQETCTPENQAANQPSSSVHSEVAETPTRRELIERYGKYALIASPLLLFASKANAIHSRP